MGSSLEVPPGSHSEWARSLFSASGEEMNFSRPLFTGDVFLDIEIDLPGEGIAPRDLVVLTHPCSMRLPTGELRPRLLAAVVVDCPNFETIDWRGNFGKTPLPTAKRGDHGHGSFDDMVVVESKLLEMNRRTACMDLFGVNLLMQRLVNFQTRVIVPTSTLSEVVQGPFEEADLLEEWVLAATAKGVTPELANDQATAWLREKIDGTRRQDSLANPQTRGRIRREARQHLNALPAPLTFGENDPLPR
jgi:hypothetical protein